MYLFYKRWKTQIICYTLERLNTACMMSFFAIQIVYGKKDQEHVGEYTRAHSCTHQFLYWFNCCRQGRKGSFPDSLGRV